MLLADYQQTGHEGEVIRYLRAAPCSKNYSEKKSQTLVCCPLQLRFLSQNNYTNRHSCCQDSVFRGVALLNDDFPERNHVGRMDADAMNRKRPADLNAICGSSRLVERLTIKRVKQLKVCLKG